MSVLKPIEIKAEGAKARLSIDGVEIDGIRGYTLVHHAGELPRLTLDVMSLSFQVSATEAQVDASYPRNEAVEENLVAGFCVNESGMVEMTMMLARQPNVTFTLSKHQAQMISAALNRACQWS